MKRKRCGCRRSSYPVIGLHRRWSSEGAALALAPAAAAGRPSRHFLRRPPCSKRPGRVVGQDHVERKRRERRTRGTGREEREKSVHVPPTVARLGVVGLPHTPPNLMSPPFPPQTDSAWGAIDHRLPDFRGHAKCRQFSVAGHRPTGSSLIGHSSRCLGKWGGRTTCLSWTEPSGLCPTHTKTSSGRVARQS